MQSARADWFAKDRWKIGTRFQELEMNTYIAFLRGINVGGNNILPMKELSKLLEDLGLQTVKTYLASGNVVFQHQRFYAHHRETPHAAAHSPDLSGAGVCGYANL